MEIQSVLTDQRTEVDVHGSPKSVPTRKSLFLLTLNIPERIADVLEVEPHTSLEQARPLAAPVSEEMPMRALTRLVAVRATKRLSQTSLAVGAVRKDA
jgi:hypothetical protein